MPAGISEDEDFYDEFDGDDTMSEDPRYTELVVQHDRVFQRYAIDEELYFVPVDPVSHIRCRRKSGNLDLGMLRKRDC
jgi:uncharacterized protein (DUF1499 family)